MEQKNKRRFRCVIGLILLLVGMILLILCNIGIGSVSVPIDEVVKCFAGSQMDATIKGIVWDIRLPRALSALVLGGALALSGYLLQTFFHNPIAGPFVLGISSGSKLVVALVMVFCGEALSK